MSPRFRKEWRLFKLMLMVAIQLFALLTSHLAQALDKSSSAELDPMEPCYLANNRASESLTISESTPVGTIVGEIMVNGDSSTNGNIELSIRMPAGSATTTTTQATGSSPSSITGDSRLPVGTQQQQSTTNGYAIPTKRLGSSTSMQQEIASDQQGQASSSTQGSKSARDLTNLIDLMPPLSIERDTKRLILAKKLDRENLDRYIVAGGYTNNNQAATSSMSQSSSSASLTVHIKCQLRPQNGQQHNSLISNSTLAKDQSLSSSSSSLMRATFKEASNSIIIPIHLIVTDENDNWPSFIGSPYIVDLNETVQVGTLLQGNEIVAIDQDQQGPLSTIEYSILPGNLHSDSFTFLNPLDARSLIVKDNRLLDYESQSKLTLKIMARDQGEPSNWAISSLYINLLDGDDLNPVFSEDKYFGYVKDNRPGEIVELKPKRLVANDGDRGLNAKIVYSFHRKTNHSVHFDLDPELGRLSLKKSLSEQATSERQPFCLLIKATQVDNPQRWSLTSLNVRLSRSPINQKLEQLLIVDSQNSTQISGLKFTQDNYTLELSESVEIGTNIVSLKAVSQQQQSERITYQLLDNELGYFNLDENSGRLSLNKSLDYELYRYLSIRVLATLDQQHEENSLPRLQCDIARVNIVVLNYNDFKPEFSHEQYNFQLSISDLIENFNLPKVRDEQQVEKGHLQSGNLRKRSDGGELEGVVVDEQQLELGFRAMQLGKVYCADRDLGERISLQLSGSKVSLFHLTQDGRLYLPLINVSSQEMDLNSVENVATWSRGSPSSNQFSSQRRLFANLRRTDTQIEMDQLDQKYLNYLLGELSTLSRLKLKVLAQDDGQPERKQSIALIVISIISIDNFILQRAAPQFSNLNTSSIQLTNQTSYEMSRSEQDNNETRSPYSNQVMMIPATNGRSFVQINSDIVSNLISHQQRQVASSYIGDKQVVNNTKNNRSQNNHDLATSQSIGSSLSVDTSSTTTNNRFQPPSLLLVDDDGAKFVAMPAAIEVYNQQVQEAAEQQQLRQKSSLHGTNFNTQDNKQNSLWYNWLFGSRSNSNNNSEQQVASPLYWLNLSAAVMLHLIAVAIIVTLVLRLRSSLDNDSSSSSLGGRSNFSRFYPRLNFFHMSRNSRSVVSILDQATGTYGGRSCATSNSDSLESSNSSFLAQQVGATSRPTLFMGDINEVNKTTTNQNISCGIIVSAMSNGYRPRSSPDGAHMITDEAQTALNEVKQQSNLFGHLKLALDKMLEVPISEKRLQSNNNNNRGLVSIKPLDTDSIPVSNTSYRLPNAETILEVKQVSNQVVESSKKRDKSSTFVGNQQRAFSPQQAGFDTHNTSAVTTINIPAPKSQPVETCPNYDEKVMKYAPKSSNSSSSSVVSLVSTSSSSISNKIKAAVERTSNRTTGSDVSSLDSTTLFNGSPQLTRVTVQKIPVPPPPPPPPPSLVQVSPSQTDVGRRRTSYTSSSLHLSETKPFSSCPIVETKSRRSLPQNPLHVKLKEQAAQMDLTLRSNSQKRVKHRNQTDLLQQKRQQIDGNSQDTTSGSDSSINPPTPPPLPGSDLSVSIKTVSPTTSVDRGYESLQSLTATNQQQPPKKRNANPRMQLYDLSGQQQVGHNQVEASRQSGQVTGRLAQRLHQQLSSQAKSSHLPEQVYGIKRRKGSLSIAVSKNGLSSSRRDLVSKIPSQLQARQQTNSSQSSINTNNSTRKNVQYPKTQSQQRSLGVAMSKEPDCESEDEDFFYCYDERGLSSNRLAGGDLLSDYASHTYAAEPALKQSARTGREMQQRLDANPQDWPSPVQGRSQLGSSSMGSMSMNGHHATPVGNNPQCLSYLSDRHHRHYHNGGNPNSMTKKQLTWSDQVGMA